MTIRIDELINQQAEVDVQYKGHAAKVTYRPDAYTPAMERAARARQEDSDWTTGVVLDMLEPLLADWDLSTNKVDADGKVVLDQDNKPVEVKLEPTRENMERVPVNLLLEILRQVTEDMRPGEAKGETSRGGSLRAV
jgi:hypothetical protein